MCICGKVMLYSLCSYHCAYAQYFGKSETPFNIRLNNHRKNVKVPNALPAHKHSTLPGYDFTNNAKFALIEMLTKTNLVKTPKKRLKNLRKLLDKKNKNT